MTLSVRRAGVGPKPIPIDKLTEDKLVEALQYMTRPAAKAAAKAISARMQEVRKQNSIDRV
jgi:hypothetical protein